MAWERTADDAHTPDTRKVKLRSAMVMSPEPGGVFDTLLMLVRHGLGGQAGNGRQFVSWIHEQDFMQAIYWLIGNDVHGAVNIASPNPLPNPDKPVELNPELSKFVRSADQPFKSDTVYFEYDKSTIKSGDVSKVERVASGIKGLAGKALRIEGHCDERGTEEYNRSLGERRAFAVREALMRAGLDPNLVDTISFGEDRPADPGHNEAAWSKNRRGEFIVIEPPSAATTSALNK